MKSPKIEKAATMLVSDQPFFATILLRMQRVECRKRPTMSTDGKYIWYNPDFVEGLTTEECMGVLCHEVLHPAMQHQLRMNGRDHRKWNVAADYAINPIVKSAGMVLPEGALLDDKYANMSAEEIYALLPECPEEEPSGGGGEPQEGEGEGEGEGSESQDGDGNQGVQPCPWGGVEEPKNPDGSDITDADRKTQEGNWKVILQQAAATAKKVGKLPAGMERLIEDLMEPKLDWRTILARWAGDLARVDYSFRYPNTRYLGFGGQGGFVLPSLKKESIGKVVFGMDTSGSMCGDELRDIVGEVCGALKEYEQDGVDPEVTILWCDTEVHEQQVSDPSDFKPVGGGGTRFSPVFKHIIESGMDPRAVVYLTDGYCDDFGEDPGCPVLWGLTNKCPGFDPPFGETMVINQ